MAKTGQTIEIAVDPRYVKFNRAFAIGNVFDALVELITNSDDSYDRLSSNGAVREKRILIEYFRRVQGGLSTLVVRDRAEGMTADEMLEVLGKIGGRTSKQGNRGFMGRGLRDCAELGQVIVQSVKDGRFYSCEISPDFKLRIIESGRAATEKDRGNLHVGKANGTSVTIFLRQGLRVPKYDTIKRELPWHYALRDILSTQSDTKVFIRDSRTGGKDAERVSFTPPQGERIVKERIEVPGFQGAYCDLEVYRHSEPFEQRDGKFRQNGLLVKGLRAIHECSFLLDDMDKDVLSSRLFGRLDSPYFDFLLEDYDERTSKNEPTAAGNPRLLVDPNRQKGLIRDHPFVEALISVLRPIWKRLLEEERKRTGANADIENEDTRQKLDRLAKRISQLFKEELEETDSGNEGDDGLRGKYALEQMAILPEFVRMHAGEDRRLTVYVRKANALATVFGFGAESDAVELESSGELRDHERWSDVLVGSIKVRALAVAEPLVLTARCGELSAEALVEVVSAPDPSRQFTTDLEFERSTYSVREKRQRTLKLFLRIDDESFDGVVPDVKSARPDIVLIRSVRAFMHAPNGNYALAEVVVEGRQLGASAEVSASCGGFSTSCVVAVKSADDKDTASFQIKIVDEDFGIYRSEWKEGEGILRIAAKHSSLRRYLKAPKNEGDEWEGQSSPHFRILIAEIVADSAARRLLLLDARQRPYDYDDWRDAKDSESLADFVLYAWEKKRMKVLSIAHRYMLADEEVPN